MKTTEQKLEEIIKEISELAKRYREEYKDELTESEDIEEYGLNEFTGGLAEGCEECLDTINNIINQ